MEQILSGFILGVLCTSLFWILFSFPRIKPVVSYQVWLERKLGLESLVMKYNYLGDKESERQYEAELFAHQIKKPKMPWPERLWNKE